MSRAVDRSLAFHRPGGMSCSHYRAVLREHVARSDRFCNAKLYVGKSRWQLYRTAPNT